MKVNIALQNTFKSIWVSTQDAIFHPAPIPKYLQRLSLLNSIKKEDTT